MESRTIRTVTKKKHRNVVDSYLCLVQEHPLRAIRTRSAYAEASPVLDRLALRDDLDDGEQQYLDALEVLIAAYDDIRHPVHRDKRTPLGRLKAVLRTSGTTPSQLRETLGTSQSMVSMILGGQRDLSKKAIVKLAERFKLDASYFL